MTTEIERLQKMADSLNLGQEAGMATSPIASVVQVPTTSVLQPETTAPMIQPVIVQQAPAKPGRKPATAAETAEKANTLPFRKPNYFRGALDRLIHTGERVKIYKREDDGRVIFIKTYSYRELEQSNDIEEFLQRYIVPKYGAGDYEIGLMNSKGEETRSVAYSIMDPTQATVAQQPASENVTLKMTDQLLTRISQLEQQTLTKKEPTLSDRLAELKTMREMFGHNGQQQPDMMTMLMLMEKISPKQPTVDPALYELRQTVSDLKRKLEVPAQPQIPISLPPMPAPEPAVDINGLIKTVTEMTKPQLTVQDMIALMRPVEQPKGVGLTEIMSMIQTLAPIIKSLLGVDQTQELIKQMQVQQAQASKGLRESLEDIRLFSEAAKSMGLSGGGDDNFWSMANNIFSGVGELVREIRGSKESQPTRNTGRGASPARSLPSPQPQQQEPATEENDNTLEFPDGIEKYVKAIAAAKDDGGYVEATLNMLKWLARNPKWQAALKNMMELAKANTPESRKEMLQFLDNMFSGLVDGEMLTAEIKKLAIEAFEKHLDKVIAVIVAKPKK